MPSRGRPPTRLTPTTHQQIVNAMRAGASLKDASRAYGVSEVTTKEWLQRGRAALAQVGVPANALDDADSWDVERCRQRERPYANFAVQVAEASALARVALVGAVRQAAQGLIPSAGNPRGVAPDWKAAAWLLERMDPAAWAPPPKRVEVTGAGGQPLAVAAVEARERIAERLARMQQPAIEAEARESA